MVPTYDYVIIGGGIAGLYMAYKLNKREPNKKILILERNRTIGGRIDTVDNKYEAGAMRFHDNHKLLLALIYELGLSDKIEPTTNFEGFIPSKGKQRGQLLDWKQINTITNKLTPPIPNDITFMEFAKQNNRLTDDEIKLLNNFYGYSSELTVMNAKDTVALMRRHFNSKRQYYNMKGGLSQIIQELRLRINAHVMTRRRVTNIEYAKGYFEIECEDIKQKYTAEKCICAVTKDTLLQFPIFKPIYPLLGLIKTLPLCRIYSQVPDLPKVKITTDNNLRIVIPIDDNKNTVMMSYTDNKYARFWKKMLDEDGIEQVNIEHKRLLEQTFNREVAMPKNTQVFYWEHGVAYFAPGFDSETMPKEIMKPLKDIPIFVCGENYSERNNQWMEGALDTSEYIIKFI